MDSKSFLNILHRYKQLQLDQQVDYDKLYLYSIITHSTAIEGSTMTEIENQVLFDNGITSKGKSIYEQNMNLDLKAAYERAKELAKAHTPLSKGLLKHLSALVMRRTGGEYNSIAGSFDSSRGDFRKVNVNAGPNTPSYLSYTKIEESIEAFCERFNRGRESLLNNKDDFQAYILSFDVHNHLVAIHPWVDGNGRMSRLMMNYIQFEFGLVPANVMKEDRVEYINALIKSREESSYIPFREFMIAEHSKNLQKEIENYNREEEDSDMSIRLEASGGRKNKEEKEDYRRFPFKR